MAHPGHPGITEREPHRPTGCQHRRVAALVLGCLLAGLLTAARPEPASAQIEWLNFEDGDALNVSSGLFLPAGRFEARGERGLERSADRGEVLIHRFRLTYSLTPYLSVGGSTVHYQQRRDDLFKDGMGDSDLFVKLGFQPWKHLPFHLGLRQSLSLPTGFEQERAGLAIFTSRHNDYTAQALLTYETRGLRIDLNPGVIVTGGDAPTYLTIGGALALQDVTWFDLDLQGEYFTRWNMVTESFETDVFGRVERPLFWGVSVHAGVKRRLLQSSEIDPEIRFGLSLGRPSLRDLYIPEPSRTPVHLAVPAVMPMFADPYGYGDQLHDRLRTVPEGRTDSHIVYLDTMTAGEVTAQIGRTHELRLRLLELDEGRVSGTRIPMLLKAPRAQTRMSVQLEVIGPSGIPLQRPKILEAEASRGLGTELAPSSMSYEILVVPDEIKQSLREEVLREMAAQIVETAARIVSEGETR